MSSWGYAERNSSATSIEVRRTHWGIPQDTIKSLTPDDDRLPPLDPLPSRALALARTILLLEVRCDLLRLPAWSGVWRVCGRDAVGPLRCATRRALDAYEWRGEGAIARG